MDYYQVPTGFGMALARNPQTCSDCRNFPLQITVPTESHLRHRQRHER